MYTMTYATIIEYSYEEVEDFSEFIMSTKQKKRNHCIIFVFEILSVALQNRNF